MTAGSLCPLRTILQKALRSRIKPSVSTQQRAKKKALHECTTFFIEKSWHHFLENGIAAKFLSAVEKIPEGYSSTMEYLEFLTKRNPCFGWAWVRARIDAVLDEELSLFLPVLEREYPAEWKRYTVALRAMGHYWFRQSIGHHLRLGYHTAVSVTVKFLGTRQFDPGNPLRVLPEMYVDRLLEDAKVFAAFDLEMLTAADGKLWDSAGATHFSSYCLDNEELKLPEQIGEEIPARVEDTYTHVEALLGCPALRSKDGDPFSGLFKAIARTMSKIAGHL